MTPVSGHPLSVFSRYTKKSPQKRLLNMGEVCPATWAKYASGLGDCDAHVRPSSNAPLPACLRKPRRTRKPHHQKCSLLARVREETDRKVRKTLGRNASSPHRERQETNRKVRETPSPEMQTTCPGERRNRPENAEIPRKECVFTPSGTTRNQQESARNTITRNASYLPG